MVVAVVSNFIYYDHTRGLVDLDEYNVQDALSAKQRDIYGVVILFSFNTAVGVCDLLCR